MIEEIKKIALPVISTLGPKGNTVLVMKNNKLHFTKDGVTVAKYYDTEGLGYKIVKMVAEKTGDSVGDGTTTTVLLLLALLEEGLKYKNNGVAPSVISVGIKKAVKEAIDKLKIYEVDIDDVYDIAMISSNNDVEIALNIQDALKKAGKSGLVMLEKTNDQDTKLSIEKGIIYSKTFAHPDFKKQQQTIIQNPYICLITKPTYLFSELEDVVNFALEEGKPIVFIGEEIKGEALSTLRNACNQNYPVYVLDPPKYGKYRSDMMLDIEALTNATIVHDDTIIPKMLGEAENIIVTEELISITPSINSELLNIRLFEINDEINNSSSEFDKEQAVKRLAMLTDGVIKIKIGGITETERDELFDRYEDALFAAKAALEQGVVLGGGVELYSIKLNIPKNSPFFFGYSIVNSALKKPLEQIVGENADKYKIFSNAKKRMGYDINTGNKLDFVKNKIFDPALVTKTALETAASMAALILTTNFISDYVKK